MRREFHVRFCEGAGVRFPRATRLVLVFSNEADAHWVRARLAERLSQYGLSLHPTKTRLVRFYPRGKGNDPGGSQSFDFLGFTHHWERSGTRWAVRRKTSSSRFGRTLLQFATWLRSHLHRPVDEQHVKIVKVLQGHDNYYGFRENYRALRRLRYEMTLIWRLRLSRRTRGPRMTWEAFQQLLRRHPFPRPRLRMA